MSRVTVDGDRSGDTMVVSWKDARSGGSCRFDRLPDTKPEWIGEADELLGSADRRQERHVLEAVDAWARGEGIQLGLWTDGVDIEVLGA